MGLILKDLAPLIYTAGNRQVFNFNKDPSSGEKDSAFTLINWFTPMPDINANSTLEFLAPNMKGFRLNHTINSTGTFGNFAIEKYDRFGEATTILGYDEGVDSLIFNGFSLFSGTSATEGDLKLEMTKKIPGTETYKGYQLSYKFDDVLGDSFSLFRNNNAVLNNLFSHSNLLNMFYFYNPVSMDNNKITNLANGVTIDNAVNKGQMDTADATTLISAQTYTNNKTWLAIQISNFDTQVRTSRLDQMTIPSANINLNSQRIINLTNPVNAQDGVTKQYVDSKSNIKSVMHGYLTTVYNTDITTVDHIKFNNYYYRGGDSITLDTSSPYSNSTGTPSIGRITLAAGKTYKLMASLCTAGFTDTSGYLSLRWYNSDTNGAIGAVTTWWHPSFNYTSGGLVVGIIITSATTRVELKINNSSNVDYIRGSGDYNSSTWFIIEEI